MLGIRVPQEPLVPGNDAPIDYVAHTLFDDSDCTVWACRGGGKTLFGGVGAVLRCLRVPGYQLRILGGSLDQSRKMFQYIRNMLWPKFLPVLGKCDEQAAAALTVRSIRFANGSYIEILPHSEKAVRGMRVNKVLCDEIEMFDEDTWIAVQLTVEGMRI